MKYRPTLFRRTPGGLWDWLTIACLSLTGLVFLTYGLIWAFPQLVPGRFRRATPAPLSTHLPTQALDATEAFPTLPPEWTAAFLLRQTPSAAGAPRLAATPSLAATAPSTQPPRTSTAAATHALSPTAAATRTATALAATPTALPPSPVATAGPTAYPAPGTPEPTATGGSYP
jgi:hypothetical protein